MLGSTIKQINISNEDSGRDCSHRAEGEVAINSQAKGPELDEAPESHNWHRRSNPETENLSGSCTEAHR